MIPAFAGMTDGPSGGRNVIPARAGICLLGLQKTGG
jgi:hypothetical protein